MHSTLEHGHNIVSMASCGEPGIYREYLGRWYKFRESGRAFSKIVLIEKYCAANVATMSQGSDTVGNPISL